MMRRIRNAALVFAISICWIGFAGADDSRPEKPRVRLDTGKGSIVIELDPTAAPATVENFLSYVREGFYEGTVFHRVIKGFMIQGGGFTPDLQQKATRVPVKNEADNGLKNRRGTIAMARTPDPHSATAQFFINTVDNAFLNFRDKSAQGWGYCVFGKVVEGMETVDAIAAVPTTTARIGRDVPVEPVRIQRAAIIDGGEKPAPDPLPVKDPA
jgi:cyclophilin family peptidyl-prolyl cis-trans isomerase